jgi:uncharacterized protein YbjT (DUF2867 family)
MNGGDAVISVLGARGPVMAEATRAIVDAAEQKGPERVVMLSSFAVARDRLSPVTKVVTGIAMGSQIKDKTAGEEVLRASSLDWTIVYATKLTNGPKTEARVVPAGSEAQLAIYPGAPHEFLNLCDPISAEQQARERMIGFIEHVLTNDVPAA